MPVISVKPCHLNDQLPKLVYAIFFTYSIFEPGTNNHYPFLTRHGEIGVTYTDTKVSRAISGRIFFRGRCAGDSVHIRVLVEYPTPLRVASRTAVSVQKYR